MQIIRPNDFSDFPAYFMQKALPYALSMIETSTPNFDNAPLHSTPTDILKYSST